MKTKTVEPKPKLLARQDGVVGLVLLALVLLAALGFSAYYVYRVRSGQAQPLTGLGSHAHRVTTTSVTSP
jgi:hypothetical protein